MAGRRLLPGSGAGSCSARSKRVGRMSMRLAPAAMRWLPEAFGWRMIMGTRTECS